MGQKWRNTTRIKDKKENIYQQFPIALYGAVGSLITSG